MLPSELSLFECQVSIACFFTNGNLLKFDAAGRNIKLPALGIIEAVGPIGHDEIVFGNGIPSPKAIASFHQIIKHKKFLWSESVRPIAALTL